MRSLFKVLLAIFVLFTLAIGLNLFEYLSEIGRYVHDLVFGAQQDFYSNLNFTFSLIYTGLSGYLLFHFIKFIKVLRRISEKALFSQVNGKAFFKVGRAMTYYSIIIFTIAFMDSVSNSVVNETLQFSKLYYEILVALGEQIGLRIPLLGIAIFILIIAKLMEDGYELKNENDLTI